MLLIRHGPNRVNFNKTNLHIICRLLFSLSVYLVTFSENPNQQRIIPLHLKPDNHSFSIFSLQFSDDGSEIIGGSNDTHVYIYDLNKQQRTLRVNIYLRKRKREMTY